VVYSYEQRRMEATFKGGQDLQSCRADVDDDDDDSSVVCMYHMCYFTFLNSEFYPQSVFMRFVCV
jgi:hypothetical protein